MPSPVLRYAIVLLGLGLPVLAGAAPPDPPPACVKRADCPATSWCISGRCLTRETLLRYQGVCVRGIGCPYQLADKGLDADSARSEPGSCKECEAIEKCAAEGLCNENEGFFFAERDQDCRHTQWCKRTGSCTALGRKCVRTSSRCQGPSTVRRLICYMDDPEHELTAIEELGRLRRDARPAMAALSKRIDKYPGDVMRALLAIGPAAIPVITRALRSQRPQVRASAVEHLARTEDRRHVAAVARAFFDSNVEVKGAVIRSLGRLYPPPDLAARLVLAALGSPEEALRIAVSEALVGEGLITALRQRPRLVVPRLTAALADPSPVVREHVARALPSLGPASLQALPALKRLLQDPVAEVRFRAAVTLSLYSVADPPVLSTMAEALRSPDSFRRHEAVLQLGLLGEKAAPAVPELVRVLSSKDRTVKVAVCLALAAIGPRTAKVVPTLVALLQDPSGPVRGAAAQAIGSFGAGGQPAVGALIAAARKAADDGERQVYILALGRIGKAAIAAGPLLKETAEGKRGTASAIAALALMMVGEKELGQRALSSQLGSADWQVRYLIATHLAEAEAKPEARKLLGELLRDPKGRVQLAAAWSLSQLGDKPLAVSVLKGLCSHPEPMLRLTAAGCLERIGESAFALKVLIGALGKETAWHAAFFLGSMGSRARAALPALRKLARSKDSGARAAALRAITNITTNQTEPKKGDSPASLMWRM